MMSWLMWMAQWPGYTKFKWALKNPEKSQREILKKILKSLEATRTLKESGLSTDSSYEDFQKALPLTDYESWQSLINLQRETGDELVCSKAIRFQPTSGSTSAQKYIPYSQAFVHEMDAAIQAWLGDVGIRNRKAFAGSQYWSLSWLPEAQRETHPGNNDLELLPAWKSYFLAKIMAVPSNVNMTHTMEESQFATLAYLCSRADLSLVSVWSPTYWLVLMSQLDNWREQIARTLEKEEWQYSRWSSQNIKPPRKNLVAAKILRSFTGPELYKKLWPNLKFISCWDSAGSQPWAAKVRLMHPDVTVQGKGLWATEGVFTIPFQNRYPIALTSHFFEWKDLATDKVHPTWELKKGQCVQPILTSGNGLLRYAMCDSLIVKDFVFNTPSFEFIGRIRETDLVGEKLSNQLVGETFNQIENACGVRPLSMLAVRTTSERPYYMVLMSENSLKASELENLAENSLSRIFNYKLAREMGQLDGVKIKIEKKPEEFYYQTFIRKGMLKGDIKLEALAEISQECLL